MKRMCLVANEQGEEAGRSESMGMHDGKGGICLYGNSSRFSFTRLSYIANTALAQQ